MFFGQNNYNRRRGTRRSPAGRTARCIQVTVGRIRRQGRIGSELRKAYYRLLGMHVDRATFLGRVQVTWPHQIDLRGCHVGPGSRFHYGGRWRPGPRIRFDVGCHVGPGCEFNILRSVTFGRHCMIAAGCRFIDHHHDLLPFGERLGTIHRSGPILIGHNVWFGANVIVLAGVEVGDGAVIGAQAVVTRSVPAGEVWAGVPARHIGHRPRAAPLADIGLDDASIKN